MVLGRRPLTPQAAIPFITSHLQSDDKGLRPAVYDACAEVVKESREELDILPLIYYSQH